uniref:C-type lectin domain-containing protein n=1 Tax=Gadus morhua TaxID=8049 RepID=A0A8C5FLK8_GADMO
MWKNILLFLSLSGLVGHHASPITKLYHFVDQKMTWTDAQRHCREHFDDMATVVNREELKQLQESMIGSDNDDDSMWIGLYDDITRWSNYNQTYIMGQHYGNWAPGEPNLGAAEEICTKINQSTGQWMDVQCSNPNQVVCINDEGDYIYVPDQMTWHKALELCKSNNTQLASVRDASENTKLVAVLESDAWLWLHRRPWSRWSDGRGASYFNWKTGEPNNSGNNEHCIFLRFNTGLYYDYNCGSLLNVACQQRAKTSTFKLKISSEANLMDPEVQRQFVEQLSAKLAKEGVTGVKLHLVLKEGQDQRPQK